MFDTFQIIVKDFDILSLEGFDRGQIVDKKTNNYYQYYKKNNIVEGLNLIYVTIDKLKIQFSQKILNDYPRTITIKDFQFIENKINDLGYVLIHNIFECEIKRVDFVYSIDAENKINVLRQLALNYSGIYPKKLYKSSLVIDSNPRFTTYDKLKEDKNCNNATKEYYKNKLRSEVQIRGRETLRKYFNTKIKKSKSFESLRMKNKKECLTAYDEGILVKDLQTFNLVALHDYIQKMFTKNIDKKLTDLQLKYLVSELGKITLKMIFKEDTEQFIKSKLKHTKNWKRYLPKNSFKETEKILSLISSNNND